VADPRRRADAEAVSALMTEVTGGEPQMWGTSMPRVSEVDEGVLRQIVRQGFGHLNGRTIGSS
jgi:hypothetical protein